MSIRLAVLGSNTGSNWSTGVAVLGRTKGSTGVLVLDCY